MGLLSRHARHSMEGLLGCAEVLFLSDGPCVVSMKGCTARLQFEETTLATGKAVTWIGGDLEDWIGWVHWGLLCRDMLHWVYPLSHPQKTRPSRSFFGV